MLVKAISRKEFLDVLQGRGVFQRSELSTTDHISTPYGNRDEIQLVWSEDDVRHGGSWQSVNVSVPPRLIVVKAEERRDFLAWVWTYLPEFRPLTAYTRVLYPEELRALIESKRAPQLEKVEEACLGLILGEAATYVEQKHEKKPVITPLSCAGTCSYAMARALALSEEQSMGADDQSVARSWMKARSLTKQQPLRLKPEELARDLVV